MLRFRATFQAKSAAKALRKLHTVPELENISAGRGVEGLFSAEAVNVAWFQYQKHLLDRLNTLTGDISDYSDLKTPFEVMTNAMLMGSQEHSREIAAVASMAYNNEFFFRSLRPSANPNAIVGPAALTDAEEFSSNIANLPMTTKEREAKAANEAASGHQGESNILVELTTREDNFTTALNQSFDSPLALRELLVNRADAPVGNGYVWLIFNNHKIYAVNSYNWAGPHASRQATDLLQTESASDKLNFGGHIDSFAPLLCINTWQHCYLLDYGVAGKRRYLRNLFDSIDWDVVSARYDSARERGDLPFR